MPFQNDISEVRFILSVLRFLHRQFQSTAKDNMTTLLKGFNQGVLSYNQFFEHVLSKTPEQHRADTWSWAALL